MCAANEFMKYIQFIFTPFFLYLVTSNYSLPSYQMVFHFLDPISLLFHLPSFLSTPEGIYLKHLEHLL